MTKEIENLGSSTEIDRYAENLTRLEHRIAAGLGKSGVINLLIGGGVAALDHPGVSFIALSLSTLTGVAILTGSHTAISLLKWRHSFSDRHVNLRVHPNTQ